MALEPKGAYNRAPIFNGENYGYWNDCMRVHINLIDMNVWTAIQNGPFKITMRNDAGAIVPKPDVIGGNRTDCLTLVREMSRKQESPPSFIFSNMDRTKA